MAYGFRIMESKKQRSTRHNTVLLEAARVFAERGYANVSLDDVATALGITRPALYYYARSKENLLLQCAEPALEGVMSALEAAQTEPTGAERVASFFRGYANIVFGDLGHCLSLVDSRDLTGEALATNRNYRREVYSSVERLIVQGIADQSIKVCDPPVVRRAMIAAFNSLSRWYRADRGVQLELLIDNLLDLFMTGLKQNTQEQKGRSRP
jgi:TetR/AcrR family transcriptional regulator, cholesterol catabolism regulator